MKELFIGEVVKRRRKELGLTQEELCEGICEPSTISRIESGRQVPAKNKLDALLQRLGLPGDRYYALLSKNELEISNLQSQIISCNVSNNKQEEQQCLKKLEEIVSEDDHLVRQFILRSKIAFGYLDGENLRPYTYEEKERVLFEALYLTVPKFDIDEINNNVYTVEEIKIINQIALNYSDAGQNKTAIDIYHQLLKYIKKHLMNLKESNGLLILIAYNYSRSLYFEKRYEDSIDIANLGLETSIKERCSSYLGGFLSVLGHAFYAEGRLEESKKYFYQSFYIYTVLRDDINIKLAKENLKEFFNIDVSF